MIFAAMVSDPLRHGVIGVVNNKKAISIEEKSSHPCIALDLAGVWFLDNILALGGSLDYAKK